jgi:hypothetical protein
MALYVRYFSNICMISSPYLLNISMRRHRFWIDASSGNRLSALNETVQMNQNQVSLRVFQFLQYINQGTELRFHNTITDSRTLTCLLWSCKWITPEISVVLWKNPVLCLYPVNHFSNAGIFCRSHQCRLILLTTLERSSTITTQNLHFAIRYRVWYVKRN